MYSDGSGFGGRVAAAAAVYEDGEEPLWVAVDLGTEEERTVYEAEVIGMAMAVHLAAEHTRASNLSLGVDNQAALRCLEVTGARPGQQLTRQLANTIKAAKRRRRRLKVKGYWTPGHQNIEGNEFVDDKAKDAAQHGSQNTHLLPSFLQHPLPASIAAKRQSLNAQIKADAILQWTQSPYHERTTGMDENMGTISTTYTTTISTMSKNRASLITQLRTGHIGLNKHLHRMGKAESPDCPHCAGIPETVLHFLIQCPAYEAHRREIHGRLSSREARNVATLVGRPKYFPMLLRYVDLTERLKDTFGRVALDDLPE